MIGLTTRNTRRTARAGLAFALALAGFAGAADRAAAGEAAQAARPVGVVRVTQVLKDYRYYVDRQEYIKKELEPRRLELEQLTNTVRKIDEELRVLMQQGAGEDNPAVRAKMVQRQRAELEIRELAMVGEEMERKLSVQLVADVYRYYNAACVKLGRHYNFYVVLSALDPEIDPAVVKDPSTNWVSMLNMIIMRSVQYVHPNFDITAHVTAELNNAYARFLEGVQRGQNLPIYPLE